MPILMLKGWHLTKAQENSKAALKDDEAEDFWLNTAHLVSAHAMERGDKHGFALKDTSGDLHFLCISPEEMSQMVRMAVNEARLGV